MRVIAMHDETSNVRMGSLGDRLAEVLRERVVRGEYRPGMRLVEGALADEFDVSRGPVRDAIAILASQGLVESKRQGVVVRGLTAADIDELYTLRMAIEALALERAIERHLGDRSAWGPAEQQCAKLQAAADSGDLRHYAEYDLSFHTEFYRLSDHIRLQHIWDQYRPIFAVILRLSNEQDAHDLHPSAEDHEVLLAHALRGDIAQAKAVLDNHLRGSLRRIRRALSLDRPSPAAVD
jgi:GntR family transcriptional regulator of gluconate operon